MKWNKMVPEITVTNFEKSFFFYTKVLGFKVVHKRENPKFVYLDLNDAQIMLEEYHEQGWYTADLKTPFGRGLNFQIEVDNLDRVHESVLKNGINLFRPLKETWYTVANGKKEGQREFLIQDPDGYLLRFSQYLE